jgi:hypothetical protein
MNIFKRFLLISLVMSIVGCATAPIESRNQASRYLSGQCLQTFLNSAGGGFDGHYGVYLSQPLNKLMNPLGLGPKGYFAVAIAANGSNACGWKTNMAGSDAGLSYERLAEEALAKCDVSRRQKSISEPCKLFAKDMDVIYEKNTPVKRMY